MAHTEKPAGGAQPLDFLAGGGEMGERIRAFDWSKTPLGPAESWSPALRTVARLVLANRLPMLLWWGPQYICIYNDPYRPVLGNKHPWGLGLPVKECWQEIWHVLQPLIDTPFHGGPATWDEDIVLVINRYGFNEETHWLIAYSPVPDASVPSGIGGVLATVHETTEKVLSERRMTALRDLGIRPAEAKTAEAACAVAANTLEAHRSDIPFALLYLSDEDGRHARLAATAGVAASQDIGQQVVDLDREGGAWPFAEVRRTMQPQVVADLGARFSSIPPGPWPDPPTTAVVEPIGSGKPREPAGFLVAGVSRRLRLDDAYLSFLSLVTTQIGAAIANARAYEEEKRRAESLAELDRAKTTFFSNVSHEFRTPLTLILGPLDDAIGDATERPQRDRLLTLKRNALRLQKLVNTLLDVSRIEARRVQVRFQPVDLAALTTDLASNFQSACEKAGLELAVDCAPLSEPVYVDAEMWEKIVLNLISNAFKFTLKGRIEVTVRQSGPHAELAVRDTGVGIPADQMPRLFERFHQVEGVTGRTQEGSGIGLALVRELVRLHGGEIGAESVAGEGTSFVVTIPVGTAHLQGQHIAPAMDTPLSSSALRAGHYVEEALRWLPDGEYAGGEVTIPEPGAGQPASGERPRIVLADDNADMRQYLQRLLSESYDVEAVPDGQAAMDAVKRSRPDLILADVMMPRLDGFRLLREIRADRALCDLPVILLSARAGEDSRVEGMQAVADDYLVKPFGARELLARVSAHVQMARLRKRAEEGLQEERDRLRVTLASIGDAVITTDTQGRITFLNGVAESLTGWTNAEASGRPLDAVFHIVNEHSRQPVQSPAAKALREGVVVGLANHTVVIRKDGTERPVDDSAAPVRDGRGQVVGCVLVFRDVTDRRRAEEANERLAAIVESSDDIIASKDLNGIIKSWNRGAERILGYTAEEVIGKHVSMLMPPEQAEDTEAILGRIRRGEKVDHYHTRRRRKDGTIIDVSLTVSPIRNAEGELIGASKVGRDITAENRAREERERLLETTQKARADAEAANRLKDEFLATLSHELRTPLNAILGWARILSTGTVDAEDLEEGLAVIDRNARVQVQIIEDLLDVSRIISGNLRLDVQRVNMVEVIDAAVAAVTPAAEAKAVRLKKVLDPLAGPVSGDPARLQQVIWNLVSNAVKFTPKGGHVQVLLERVNSHVEVSVIDTGVGIHPDFLPHVFERFRQADSSTTRRHGGLGLGLAIVKQLTEQQGGTVRAKSPGEGQGATFVVSLPIPVAHEAPPEKARPKEQEAGDFDGYAQPLSGIRVLVVDDEVDARALVRRILAECGAEVAIASSVNEAMQLFEGFRPDILVSDVGMPDRDGYDLIREVRGRVPAKTLPAVALTAFARPEDRRRALLAGFQTHVAKPVDPAELVAVVASLVERTGGQP